LEPFEVENRGAKRSQVMKRIKVISEVTDLVPMFHSVDTEVKRQVFQEASQSWLAESEIKEKFGDEGMEAIRFFDKMKLVKTQWKTTPNGPEKAYLSYYTTFQIDTSCPVLEISDILHVVSLPNDEFRKMEDRMIEMVNNGNNFAGNVSKELDVSLTMLKGLIKRSGRLDFRGHVIEIIE
jgi:predicted DNA-binding ArsR family transcriptional regulator